MHHVGTRVLQLHIPLKCLSRLNIGISTLWCHAGGVEVYGVGHGSVVLYTDVDCIALNCAQCRSRHGVVEGPCRVLDVVADPDDTVSESDCDFLVTWFNRIEVRVVALERRNLSSWSRGCISSTFGAGIGANVTAARFRSTVVMLSACVTEHCGGTQAHPYARSGAKQRAAVCALRKYDISWYSNNRHSFPSPSYMR